MNIHKIIRRSPLLKSWKWPYVRLIASSKTLVMLYHSVPKFGSIGNMNGEIFENHVCFLKKYFNLISYEDLNSARKRLEKIRVLITLDDGFRNNYETAFPILRKHEIPAIFFLSSRHSIHGKVLWFNYLNMLEMKFNRNSFTFNGKILDMSSIKRRSTMLALKKELLELKPHPTALYKTIDEQLPKLMDFMTPEEYNNFCAGMSSEQISKIASNPLYTIGIHTVDHPYLSLCDDEEVDRQIRENKIWIEKATGKECNLISYPIGDYNKSTLDICRKMGITTGFAVNPIYRKFPGMECTRIGIYQASTDVLGFKVQWGNLLRSLHIKRIG